MATWHLWKAQNIVEPLWCFCSGDQEQKGHKPGRSLHMNVEGELWVGHVRDMIVAIKTATCANPLVTTLCSRLQYALAV